MNQNRALFGLDGQTEKFSLKESTIMEDGKQVKLYELEVFPCGILHLRGAINAVFNVTESAFREGESLRWDKNIQIRKQNDAVMQEYNSLGFFKKLSTKQPELQPYSQENEFQNIFNTMKEKLTQVNSLMIRGGTYKVSSKNKPPLEHELMLLSEVDVYRLIVNCDVTPSEIRILS